MNFDNATFIEAYNNTPNDTQLLAVLGLRQKGKYIHKIVAKRKELGLPRKRGRLPSKKYSDEELFRQYDKFEKVLEGPIRNRYLQQYGHCCVNCKSVTHLHLHHKDFNNRNNELNNFLLLCKPCHILLHQLIGETGIMINTAEHFREVLSKRAAIRQSTGLRDPKRMEKLEALATEHGYRNAKSLDQTIRRFKKKWPEAAKEFDYDYKKSTPRFRRIISVYIDPADVLEIQKVLPMMFIIKPVLPIEDE